ncbi:dienelactone hydrolase family protein [Pontibacter sp. HSC-36F09]|uniref:dienelactone hydrolase family protein n=1 Tax=Pontibacter sp. HSC-36F09 TaxID=2910966 RepID=UPI00209E69FC|nr:alpha/beta hydrolase family protein [Pontibacter sp. HSC-36F09]MCP2043372.1 dienelactone hydrolase [Pontibacter sp. HSC-36F09]
MQKSKVCCLYLVSLLLVCCFPARGQTQTSDIGNFYPVLRDHASQQNSSLSYLNSKHRNTEKWRKEAKGKLQELLAYNPAPVPLQSEVISTTKRDGYTQYLVRYMVSAHQQTEAFLLIPDNLTKPAPAVIALHDHGGFYFFGKEKHSLTDDQPEILKTYIQNLYEGRTYADELAKRGFIVLSPDAPYFGSQKLDPEQVSDDLTKNYRKQLTGEQNADIKTYNKFANGHEAAINKTVLAAGTTWLGMIVQSDRVAIDYLLSRPEVDPERIGCIGLSLGGLRSTYLFGLDARVKTGIVAAFSTTFEHMLRNHTHHTWMMYVPRQNLYLDLPDVASLNAPRPLLVMNCKQDKLFNPVGMEAAETKLAGIYSKMKATDKFKCNYYDVPHSMTIAMQEDAFEWLEKWLK